MIIVTVMFRDRNTERTECLDYAQMVAVIKFYEDQMPWEIFVEIPHAVR